MMKVPAHKQTEAGKLPGQKTLGDYLEMKKEVEETVVDKKSKDYQFGYAEGYLDGKTEGFKQGVAWSTGRGDRNSL